MPQFQISLPRIQERLALAADANGQPHDGIAVNSRQTFDRAD